MTKTSITEIGGTILGICIAFLYAAGCIHSDKKHPNDGDILRYTPFSIYRGVEMFWHDDFKGVNWKEKISDDINTSIKLLSAVTQTYDLVNTKQQIEDFTKQLSKYPNDKRKEIANTVRRFLNFGDLWTKDMILHLERADSAINFKFSLQSQQAYDSLMNYYYIAEMKDFKNLADSITKEILKFPENKQMYIDRFKDHDRLDISQYGKYFQKMFNEPL